MGPRTFGFCRVPLALWLLSCLWGAHSVQAQQCFPVDFYYDSSVTDADDLRASLQQIADKRGGLRLYFRDVHRDEKSRQRLDSIREYFQLDTVELPALYGLKQLAGGIESEERLHSRLEKMLTMTAWVRSGCPHCRAAKDFLRQRMSRYPALKIDYREVTSSPAARQEMQRVVKRYRQQASSLPVLHYCNGVNIGFDRASTTGQRILKTLDYWSRPCPGEKKKELNSRSSRRTESPQLSSAVTQPCLTAAAIGFSLTPSTTILSYTLFAPDSVQDEAKADIDDDLPVPPPMTSDGSDEGAGPPLPVSDLPPAPSGPPVSAGSPDDQTVDLPVFGHLNASQIGMPLFTIAIGLVDGFNPCAMWVLLFLLSMLVNLKDRRRMLAIAGVFVLISGLAYFAFMAAWLNVFLFLGYLRAVQVALGLIGISVGAIHIKDFFALHKGLSLSIPESVKPGLYQRMRQIVNAESMRGAMAGVIVLAVLVNIVELLCTAGLPALYTNVLMMQEYSVFTNYAYLALYNIAYMFDDGLMVFIAVLTLGRHKLQEHEGRWLKLISGILIAGLGVVMIFRPEWLA